jgi:hypothetical protein
MRGAAMKHQAFHPSQITSSRIRSRDGDAQRMEGVGTFRFG